MNMFRRLPLGAAKSLLVVLVFLSPAAATPARAMAIQQVETTSGIKAWLVEDYTVPMVTIQFAFRGGSTQDPPGREGSVNLMSELLLEGAGDLDSDAFQQQLDDVGAKINLWVGLDAVEVNLQVPVERKDDAFDLLRLAIERPRFDQAPMDRVRAKIVTGITAEAKDPLAVSGDVWMKAIYGDHPYSRPVQGSPESLAAATTSDLKALHNRVFARSNLVIAATGAIDADALKSAMDQIFGRLPAEPSLMPVSETAPKLAQFISLPYDLPQNKLLLAYPGVSRKDPQFFAAYLMNHILGGESFTSRLWNEVREKRGLTYGIQSHAENYDHASAFVINTATRADRAGETLSVIDTEIKRMADEGVTEEELEMAKRTRLGGYAIHNFNSSNATANTLVDIQLKNLGIDFLDERQRLIEAVTVEDISSVAKRLLSAKPALMIVGPPLEGKKG
ncbi:insulinase family protein [Sinorhizobium medicae]|uniref:M16 family metallopeptidase n=1 Tax=Sinorhizobium medicae TaxID=110321 RepID=UPI00129779D4|nr:pitrilysin family protein [Sinorhizobium medicae]MDX2388253.1 insulinase family protein [Sinorhizobium medicae]MQU78510.1 insulinase family protein [Sinorhizobium medicae]